MDNVLIIIMCIVIGNALMAIQCVIFSRSFNKMYDHIENLHNRTHDIEMKMASQRIDKIAREADFFMNFRTEPLSDMEEKMVAERIDKINSRDK